MKIKISEIVLDYDLYPRTDVSETNVRRIADAIESGKKLPPIVLQKKSKRAIDGWHRIRAAKLLGLEFIECVLIDCNDIGAYKLAVEYNNSHGQPFTPYDYKRIILKFDSLGVTKEQVADLLNIKIDKIKEIKKTFASNYRGELIPLKNSIRHMAGKRLTGKQVDVNNDLSGMPVLFWVNQLIKILDAELWEFDNEELNQQMEKLMQLWEGVKAKI